jgi:hypothetical protein
MGIGCDGRVGLELGFGGGGAAVRDTLRAVRGPDTVLPKGDSGFCETERQTRETASRTPHARYLFCSKFCRLIYFYRASAR